jgi:hypothetical protein
MSARTLTTGPSLLLALLLIHLPQGAWACATCFGRSDSELARGMNWGIAALLLVILSVLASIAGFFVFLARRAARTAAAEAGPSASFTQPS